MTRRENTTLVRHKMRCLELRTPEGSLISTIPCIALVLPWPRTQILSSIQPVALIVNLIGIVFDFGHSKPISGFKLLVYASRPCLHLHRSELLVQGASSTGFARRRYPNFNFPHRRCSLNPSSTPSFDVHVNGSPERLWSQRLW